MGTHPLFVLFLLIGSVPTCLSALEVYLTRPIVRQESAQTFADICVSPQSDDPVVAQALAAPLPALSREPALIPVRVIKGLLGRYLPESFVLVGSRFIYLPKDVTDPGERAFDVALLRYIDGVLGDQNVKITLAIPPSESLPGVSSSAQLQFQLPAGSANPYQLAQNQFVQYSEPGASGYQTVPVTIGAYGPAAFARQTIDSGQPVTPAEIATREVDLSTLQGSPVQVTPGGLTALGSIPAGSPILAGMVERHYAVTSGQEVTVTLQRGAVAVSLPGRAFSSGEVGDSIRVGLHSSLQRLTGKIVSPTEVIVDDN